MITKLFDCGCEVAVTVRPLGDLRNPTHNFTAHCDRHNGTVRSFEIENERMDLITQVYKEAGFR